MRQHKKISESGQVKLSSSRGMPQNKEHKSKTKRTKRHAKKEEKKSNEEETQAAETICGGNPETATQDQ